MKKSILTLSICLSLSVAYGQKSQDDTTKFKSEITAQEKGEMIGILNDARATILKAVTPNTTEQNFNLVKNLEAVINFLNEKFIKQPVPSAEKEAPKAPENKN